MPEFDGILGKYLQIPLQIANSLVLQSGTHLKDISYVHIRQEDKEIKFYTIKLFTVYYILQSVCRIMTLKIKKPIHFTGLNDA